MAARKQSRNKKGQFKAVLGSGVKPPTPNNMPKTSYNPVANPEMYNAMLGKRTSNAAGTHLDKREKRVRTRNAANRKHIDEQL